MRFFDRFFGPPSKDKFATLVMETVRRAGEKGKIIYDQEQFRLLLEGEGGTRLFLGNAYQEYCAVAKEERTGVVQRFSRSWFVSNKGMPEEYEDAKPDLLPVVRARAYYENAAFQVQLEGQVGTAWPQQVVGDDLAVGLVYDLPEAMRMIVQDDLERWGITFYEALEAALDNLRQLPHSFIGPAEGEGVYLSVTNDNYDASRLLLRDTIRQFRVKGDPVAMVPNRDTLIVTGSDDAKGLEGMVALAKDALQKPRHISGLAWRLDGDDWVPWVPDHSHPLYGEFRLFQVQSFGQNYSDQKEGLDRLHERAGEDIFVASFSAMESTDTGDIISYCVWTKDVLTLLPRTDRVAFVEENKEPLMASWDRVVEVAGDLMEPMGSHPERWQVSVFPTPAQLAAMGAKRP